MDESESRYIPEANIDLAISRLTELAKSLGFSSTQEMETIVTNWDPGNATTIGSEWRQMAEQIAEESDGESWHKAQIGLLIESSKLYLLNGDIEGFLESLSDIILYASQIGLEDIARDLGELSSRFSK